MSEPVHHYELHGYVMEDGSVKPSPFEGWVMWRHICNTRPNASEYAVVRKLPIRNHQGKIIMTNRPDGPFLVLPFYDEPGKGMGRQLSSRTEAPEPTWAAPNADAAIMKAVMCGKR